MSELVVTTLEAEVRPDRAADLAGAYRELGTPPAIVVESFLLSDVDSDLWRVVTVFTRREDLDAMREQMRSSGQAPPGVRVFQSAGASPELTIFAVATRIVTDADEAGSAADGMVLTMLDGHVPTERQSSLVEAYEQLGDLPPFITEAFLLQAADSDLWRMMTVVRSRQEMERAREAMQESGETPGGLRVFREVGAEPELTVFDVVAHLHR